MSGREFAEWLDTIPSSTALHESLYAYSMIESTHVLALMLFVGSILMLDLRLIGVSFTTFKVSEMSGRLLPWTIAGFVVMVVTGALLFYAIPVRTYHSLWFRIKVVLFIVVAINVWVFHRRVSRDREVWDASPKPPLGARISGAVSIVAWGSVIVAGRMIAYNWFDCDRPQPDWVVSLAGCAVEAGALP